MDKNKLQIIIGFSKSRKKFPILSWIIRAIEGTPFSHTYVRWHSRGANANIVYEASGSSIHFAAKERVWDKRAIPVCEYSIEITRDTYKKLLHFCMTYAGVDYGMMQLVGIALYKFTQLLPKCLRLKGNPLSKGDRNQVCAELMGLLFEDVLGLEHSLDLDIAGTKEIHEIMENLVDKGEAFRLLG